MMIETPTKEGAVKIEGITDWDECYGTSFQGYVETTREKLSSVLGAPWLVDGEDEKMTIEWAVKIDGVVVTVYAWKAGRVPGQKEIFQYHVGGKTKAAADLVGRAIRGW